MRSKQQKLTCGYQQVYTRLQEKGVPTEHTLEHLVAEPLVNGKPCGVNRFRSLDPDPPERGGPWCNLVEKEWQEILEADEVLEALYRHPELARRLFMKLEVVQRTLKAELALHRRTS